MRAYHKPRKPPKGDFFKGQWKHLRGEIKERWGKLMDDEIEQIESRYDKFIGKIQEKYAYSEPEAEVEIKRFFKKMKSRIKV